MKLCLSLIACFFLTSFSAAQQPTAAPAPLPQRPAWLISPEVHPDNTVTFRLRAANAQDVKLAREGIEPVAMQKVTRAFGA